MGNGFCPAHDMRARLSSKAEAGNEAKAHLTKETDASTTTTTTTKPRSPHRFRRPRRTAPGSATKQNHNTTQKTYGNGGPAQHNHSNDTETPIKTTRHDDEEERRDW